MKNIVFVIIAAILGMPAATAAEKIKMSEQVGKLVRDVDYRQQCLAYSALLQNEKGWSETINDSSKIVLEKTVHVEGVKSFSLTTASCHIHAGEVIIENFIIVE